MAKKTVQECLHGLTDNCKVTRKITTDDFEMGEREIVYWFNCFEHHRPGMHIVTSNLPITA